MLQIYKSWSPSVRLVVGSDGRVPHLFTRLTPEEYLEMHLRTLPTYDPVLWAGLAVRKDDDSARGYSWTTIRVLAKNS